MDLGWLARCRIHLEGLPGPDVRALRGYTRLLWPMTALFRGEPRERYEWILDPEAFRAHMADSPRTVHFGPEVFRRLPRSRWGACLEDAAARRRLEAALAEAAVDPEWFREDVLPLLTPAFYRAFHRSERRRVRAGILAPYLAGLCREGRVPTEGWFLPDLPDPTLGRARRTLESLAVPGRRAPFLDGLVGVLHPAVWRAAARSFAGTVQRIAASAPVVQESLRVFHGGWTRPGPEVWVPGHVLSSSLSPAAARRFGSGAVDELRLLAGVRALYLGGVSGYPEECEVLLGAGQAFGNRRVRAEGGWCLDCFGPADQAGRFR
jgi:hypothetical protein